MSERLHLVDASVYVFRAWFSLPHTLTDPDGRAVNAIYGYARFLSELLEQERPAFVLVAFDESLTTSFRNAIYPQYKSSREEPPADLIRQFALCRQFTSAMGVCNIADAQYEADDIIATAAAWGRRNAMRCTILTRDKDLAQIMHPGDCYRDDIGGVTLEYADVAGRFGVDAQQIPDLLALMGDASDDIPGVPGVGRKTALALLQAFGSLANVYANLDDVARMKIRGASALARRLAQHRDSAELSLRLATLAADMPLRLSHATLAIGTPDIPRVEALCDELGFGAGLRKAAARLARH